MKVYGPRLLVSDFAKSFLFYRDTLGLAPAFGGETDSYTEFQTGETQFSLFDRQLMAAALNAPVIAPTSGVDNFVLVIAVDNVDDMYAELKAKGVEFVVVPEDRPIWGIRTAHLRDPDGYVVELMHPLPQN